MPSPAKPMLLVAGVDVPTGTLPTFPVNCRSSENVNYFRTPLMFLKALTGETVSQWPIADLNMCMSAIEVCDAAQPVWEQVRPAEKRAIFLRAAELVQSPEYSRRIQEAMESETSAHLNWINVNIQGSVGLLREAAAQAGALKGEHVISESPTCQMFITQRRAAGVVLAISPWNSPILLAFRAVAIPLICGNTVVLKTSEYSPACGRIAVDILLQAGLPRKVISYLTFDRDSAPPLTASMIAHPAIKRVNFTGSDFIGRKIAQQCGAELKQCVLELGGSAPTVVFADSDLRQAAKAIISGGMLHGGQICMSTERVFVEDSAAQELFGELKSVAKTWLESPAGAQRGKVSVIPPLLTLDAAKRVTNLVVNAIHQGATDLLSAKPTNTGQLTVEPSILVNVESTMDISRREIFGPGLSSSPPDSRSVANRKVFRQVITVTTFKGELEAIKLANESPYSLIASLWTRDVQQAMRVAPQIHSGSVQVNGSTIHSEPAFGLAGLGGSSGYGRFNVDSVR
ncbi:hypothetical protein P7C70_g3549, partial [Phenoliferia sp. Uapishka_3]